MSKKINIYTDGACSGNPGSGGLSALILDDKGKELARINKGFRLTTNNRMEISAVTYGLKYLRTTLGYEPTETDVVIYTDSQLVERTMNAGWSRNSNADAWSALEKEVLFFRSVTFIKVKGHDTNKYNNIADELAVEASLASNKEIDLGYEQPKKNEDNNLFQQEPEVSSIRFQGVNTTDRRKVLVDLTNGTTVTITPYEGGFLQSGATKREMQITVDIAWKYVGWLNGKTNL